MQKKKKSVLLRVNLIISGIIACMIMMLAYSNIHSIYIIRNKAKSTYQSMGDYYVNELNESLNNIAEYLMRVSESTCYYELLYKGENQEFIRTTAKQQLYNQMNRDILSYSPMDYFFLYQDGGADLMLIQSVLKNIKTPNDDIRSYLKHAVKDDEKNAMWELVDIDSHQYLISAFHTDGAIIGGIVSIDRLLQSMRIVNLSDYFVSYSNKNQTDISNKTIQDDLRISVPVERTDACVNIVVPGESFYKEFRSSIRSSIFFAVALIILLPILYFAMDRWLMKPIRKIVEVMRAVDHKGFDTRMPNLGQMEEYQIVSAAFNHMMEKISELKIDIYENEKKRKELYEQYTLLQIKPHFFLNSLNTIYLLNKRGDSNHVQMMLTYLINYFRSIFSRSGDMVLLKEEINFTLNYVAIQKLRSSGNIHFQCDTGEDVDFCSVPAMSILTFVENAVNHSTDISKDLMLTVSAKRDDIRLCIQIEDNGDGIPEEILEKIRKNDRIIKDDREHVGIKNVIDRFHMHYGDSAEILIENKKSGGVRVILDLPFKE